MKIGFGMLFEVKGEKERIDLIVDVGEQDYFSAVNVREREREKVCS